MTPLKKFLTKHPTPSGMSSRQWAALSAAMREEKFFSARVENVRLLERLQGMIRDFLTGEREVLENGESVMKVGSCADFVKQAMDWLEAEGLREADGEGEEYHRDVNHVGAEARLRLIFRTNVRQAVGAAQWESAMMPANLKAWPAFRFVRFPGAKVKRPVHVANEDEVRLKSDFEFWADEMNAADLGGFEVPWPPFGFNSYMDQIPVSRKECEAMGLLKPGEPLKRPRGAERFGIDLVERYGYGKKASTAKLPEELKAKLKKYYEDRWGVKQDGADKVVFPAKQVADMAKKEAEQLEFALNNVVRRTKTAEQIEKQKARIADTIAKRLAHRQEKRDQLVTQQWADYMKQRDAALEDLDQATKEARLRYEATHSIDDLEAWIKAKTIQNEEVYRWKHGGMYYNERYRTIKKAEHSLWDATYRDSLRFLAVDGAIVPQGKRGEVIYHTVSIDEKFHIREAKHRPLPSNVRKGLDLAMALVSPSKLPKSIGIQAIKGSVRERAFSVADAIKVADTTDPAVVAHELAHVIEWSNPEILRKTASFLYDRAGGANAVSLLSIYPHLNYEAIEKTFEDNWIKCGGSAYTGKLYINGYWPGMNKEMFVKRTQATEVLSMGIQRMLESPVDFKRKDPEFYKFIKSQLL